MKNKKQISKIQISFLTIVLCVLMIVTLADAKKKITKPTERAVYHNNQGVSFLNRKDLERAEFEFKTAIELAPEYIEAFNNLGIVYKIKGNLPDAEANFKRAIELDKEYTQAYSHLGAVYLAEGKIDDAIDIIKKGLKRDSTVADAHYNLGLAYIEKTKQDKKKSWIDMAESEFKRATQLNPNLVHVHKTLAEVYRSIGEYELSIIRYRLALGNEPLNPDLWNKLGQVYLEKGDNYQAQNCFAKAEELGGAAGQTGKVEDSQMKMGMFFMQEKRYADAVNQFKMVAEKSPLNEQAWYRMGTAYFAWGEDERLKRNTGEAGRLFGEAATALKKAKEVNPQLADASYNLGLTYLKQGKTLDAQKEWEYTVTVDPRYARAYYNLGLVYQQEGRTDEGMNMFCRFLGTAGNNFPVESQAVQRSIEASKFKCQN